MNTTLLIMAAGIGSRFGTGIKQLEPVDDANHIIMACTRLTCSVICNGSNKSISQNPHKHLDCFV